MPCKQSFSLAIDICRERKKVELNKPQVNIGPKTLYCSVLEQVTNTETKIECLLNKHIYG